MCVTINLFCSEYLGGEHFGLYNVGQSMSVFCNTGDDTVLAQWIDDSGMVVADSTFSPTVTLKINPLTDGHHNHLYICRKFSASTISNTEFRIIIISKFRIALALFSKLLHCFWLLFVSATAAYCYGHQPINHRSTNCWKLLFSQLYSG